MMTTLNTKLVNNFQELFEEEERSAQEANALRGIRSNVWQTLGVFKFVGQIVEVYLPKVISMFIIASGGDTRSVDGNQPPSSGTGINPDDLRPKGPGA